jgi:COP9 signalosome complex subunit 6
MHNAIKMLKMRVNIINEFLVQTSKGGIPADHGIIRRISSLCHMLPAIDSASFRQEFINEYNDALLVAYLASIMKASNNINDLIDKFNVAFDRHSGRSRRGFF